MPVTTNYGFTLLEGSDTAGYTSINTIVNSIDNALLNRVTVANMIIMFDNTAGTGAPNGWTSLGTTVSGLPVLSTPYIYIKKN